MNWFTRVFKATASLLVLCPLAGLFVAQAQASDTSPLQTVATTTIATSAPSTTVAAPPAHTSQPSKLTVPASQGHYLVGSHSRPEVFPFLTAENKKKNRRRIVGGLSERSRPPHDRVG